MYTITTTTATVQALVELLQRGDTTLYLNQLEELLELVRVAGITVFVRSNDDGESCYVGLTVDKG